MKYLLFKGDEIIFTSDDKDAILKELSEKKPKDNRPSERYKVYQRILTKKISNNKK